MLGMNWLITGGCGFIGRRLIGALREADPDFRVRVLDNLSVGDVAGLRAVCSVQDLGPVAGQFPDIQAGVAQFVRGDIRDARALDLAAQGVDVIVHLAANTGVGPSVQDPVGDCEHNVLGTLNALQSARKFHVRRFIFASSGAPVGEVTPPIHEEVVPHPVSPYGASKLAGEGYCSAFTRTFGLETVSLRFGNVYGPGSRHKSSVVAKFIMDATSTGVLHIYGDGSQTRDFIYVDDLVQAVLAAAGAPGVGGETIQIATEKETSVREIAEIMKEKLSKLGIQTLRVVYEQPRLGDVMRNYADTSKARRLLGWKATTSVEEGIERTIRWFLEPTV